MNKPRIVKDYDKLPEELIEQIKLHYPRGFTRHLVSFVNKEGAMKKGLPFETEDRYYLIRMTEAKAEAIIEDDDDYDADGMLKDDVRAEYEEKHDDLDDLTSDIVDTGDFDDF